ncbi:MAG TPA: DUF2085 domain-containing protein [Blastocatellia bacterium]|nr:DUF2085 domain-containing protein [Blastocatellia bacterium]
MLCDFIVDNRNKINFSFQKGTIRDRLVYGLTLLGITIWLALIIAPPILFRAHYTISALIIHQSFSAICHQMPGRSFHLFGFAFSVCARCTGIYFGAFIGACCYPFLRGLQQVSFPHRRWLIFASIPISIDFFGGLSGLFVNTHFSRVMTGMIAGFAGIFFIIPGLFEVCQRSARNQSKW